MGFSRKDLNLKAKKAFAAAMSTNTTTAGTIIDTRGYRSAMFTLMCTAWTSGTFTPKIEAGDASNLSDAAEVTDTYLRGTEGGAVLGAADQVTTVGYHGKQRYVRLSVVSAGGGTGTVAAVCHLGHPESGPVTQGVGA